MRVKFSDRVVEHGLINISYEYSDKEGHILPRCRICRSMMDVDKIRTNAAWLCCVGKNNDFSHLDEAYMDYDTGKVDYFYGVNERDIRIYKCRTKFDRKYIRDVLMSEFSIKCTNLSYSKAYIIRVLGFNIGIFYMNKFKKSGNKFLYNFIIDKDYRGVGYGTTALNKMFYMMVPKNKELILHVDKRNTIATHMYNSNKFKFKYNINNNKICMYKENDK